MPVQGQTRLLQETLGKTKGSVNDHLLMGVTSSSTGQLLYGKQLNQRLRQGLGVQGDGEGLGGGGRAAAAAAGPGSRKLQMKFSVLGGPESGSYM
ncbi:unnamed protein product [Arctogadus glacialis]